MQRWSCGPVWEFADRNQIINACCRHDEYIWFSGPVSPTVAPYPPSTTTLATTSGPSGSRLGCDRSPVVFLLYKYRPDDPRHLVGERNGYQHARLASQHLFEPGTFGPGWGCRPFTKRTSRLPPYNGRSTRGYFSLSIEVLQSSLSSDWARRRSTASLMSRSTKTARAAMRFLCSWLSVL